MLAENRLPVDSLNVLAVIRAPLEQYPPSVNQVALLAEAGLRVGVVDCHHADFVPFEPRGLGTVQRFRPCRHTQLHKEELPYLAVRLWRNLAFAWTVFRIVRQRKPSVVIAFDPNAMVAVGPIWKRGQRPKVVWHFHELCSRVGNSGGWLSRRGVDFACQQAERADMLTCPDEGRANVFFHEAGLRMRPRVIMNCPRKMLRCPDPRLGAKLIEYGLGGRPAVYFHGWIGPSRCLEAVIQSMRWWPTEAVFVAVGPVAENYRRSLSALAGEVGVRDRVLFLGSVPHAEVSHLAAGAKVGCSLVVDQQDPNWTYSAGALNKRFEYMAVGLAQVASDGPGMSEIIERTGCGVLVNPQAPADIGRAIAKVLQDDALRIKMGENGRAAHLSTLNYEHQFAPVLECVVRWCGGTNDLPC